MKRNKWFISIIIFLFIIVGVTFTYTINKNDNDIINSNIKNKKIKKEYKYAFPERISKDDYFKGEFISNDIASIYPRRDAIVRDILVDIGDKVMSGDTLAILFNPGVGGEGQSKINIKKAILSSKNNILDDVIAIKDAKIAELDQKIKQQELILKDTINNFDFKISQIGNNITSGSEYGVQLKSLENLQKNLSNAYLSRDELLKESNNNIIQKRELLNSKIDEIYNKIIPILYIGNEKELNYNKINYNDFSYNFGAKDPFHTNEFIEKLKIYNTEYGGLELEEKYKYLLEINNLLIKALQNTIISVDIPEVLIKSYISNINRYNNILISEKEVLNDSENNYKILELRQKEKIEDIESQISKKENEIILLGTKSNTIKSEKTLGVSKLKAGIDILKKSKDLLIANENKTITNLKNEIAIAKSDLSNELIKSGDYKIISPFTGIISKRGISIGEKISPNTEAFRLAGVDNTLSRITRKEIKFFIPENLKDNLEVGKEVTFFTPDNESKSFTGTIYRISPEIDENNSSIIVQAKISEKIKLPNKSTIRVNLKTKQDIFRVQSKTIYNKNERKIIYYKKDNGKLGVIDINIISDDGEYSLISGDIFENLKIVTTPIFIK